MGIRGFYGFIKRKRRELLPRRQLQNTRLVIDANNFFHNIVFSNCDSSFGGDYDVIAEITEKFIQNLYECNIVPVFAYIGTHETDSREKMRANNEERIRKVATYFEKPTEKQNAFSQVFPILGRLAFNDVIVRHELQQVTTDHVDEVGQIVGLANKLSCPILSSNSDYLVSDVKQGVAYVNEMKFVNFKDGRMEVSFYHIRNFVSAFNLSSVTDVALIGAVMKYIDMHRDDLCSAIPSQGQRAEQVQRVVSMVREANRPSLSEIITVLVDQLTDDDDADDEDDVRADLEKIAQRYMNVDNSKLYEFVSGNVEECALSDLKSYGDRELPAWFRLAWRRGDIPRYPCSILTNRQTNLPCQMEDLNAACSYDCSQNIREVTYAILLSHDLDEETTIPPSERPIEYRRTVDKATIHTISPVFSLPGFETLPKLSVIPHVSAERRRELILATLGVANEDLDDVREWPMDAQLFVAIGRYWVEHASPSENQIQALVLCATKLRILNLWVREDEAVEWVRQRSEGKTISFLFSNLERHAVPESWKNAPNRAKLQHAFCQFQACFLHASELNQFLQEPFSPPRIGNYFSARLAYLYVCELMEKLSTVDKLVGKDGGVRQFYDLMLKAMRKKAVGENLTAGAQKESRDN